MKLHYMNKHNDLLRECLKEDNIFKDLVWLLLGVGVVSLICIVVIYG